MSIDTHDTSNDATGEDPLHDFTDDQIYQLLEDTLYDMIVPENIKCQINMAESASFCSFFFVSISSFLSFLSLLVRSYMSITVKSLQESSAIQLFIFNATKGAFALYRAPWYAPIGSTKMFIGTLALYWAPLYSIFTNLMINVAPYPLNCIHVTCIHHIKCFKKQLRRKQTLGT